MGKATKLSAPSKSIPTSNISFMDDVESLSMKVEGVGLHEFLTNLEGETKRHFEALMAQLGEAQDLLEEREGTLEEL
jgi:hypothetical protein